MPETLSAMVLSDFNIAPMAGVLERPDAAPAVTLHATPFGQVCPPGRGGTSDGWPAAVDAALVWTRPEGVIARFRAALDGEAVTLGPLLDEVDQWCDQLAALEAHAAMRFVASWVLPPYHRAFGVHGMRHRVGLVNLLAHMNLRLAERSETLGLHVLDAQRWMYAGGPRAFNPRLWMLGKIPYAHEVYRHAAADLKAAIRTLRGGTRKLLLLDLDNTLWGGTLGDVGPSGLTLGGHDRAGEAFVELQRAVLSLRRRGVLLGIISKNDEAAALAAIDGHPEMLIRRRDLVGWRINWEDKAANIAALSRELGLGLSSVVFVDDHPHERARVREALPDVLVPEWPARPEFATPTLLALDCFDAVDVSAEDRERTDLYAAERARTETRATTTSVDEWLRGLQTRVEAQVLTDTDLGRASQLLNRTNQMNLRTRRLSPAELDAWSAAPHRRVWTFRVSDRFGPAGLTGVASAELCDDAAEVVDFVVSCRVIGRHLEETMLHVVSAWAAEQQVRELQVPYVPSPRNTPCIQFLKRSQLAAGEDGVFRWSGRAPYPLPSDVTLSEGRQS